MTDTTSDTKESLDEKVAMELLQAGVLYSHNNSKEHPRMRQFIGAHRHEMDILDAQATIESLEKATSFLREAFTEGKSVLFVGTTSPAAQDVERIAKHFNQPYVTHRWLGGTLTNFKVIRKRIEYYIDLKEKRAQGELEKYTKKEQVQFMGKIGKLSRNLGGLEDMNALPDLLFIIDSQAHKTALAEAKRVGIPVVGVIDTNDDPEEITYPIIANDHARGSIRWVLQYIIEKIGDIKPTPVQDESTKNTDESTDESTDENTSS